MAKKLEKKMKSQLDKMSEYEIVIIVMIIAANKPNGMVTFDELKEELPNLVYLSGYDTGPNPNRPRQPIWLQRARNLKSHYLVEKNFLNKGYLEHVKGKGYKITSKGREHLQLLMRRFTQMIVSPIS